MDASYSVLAPAARDDKKAANEADMVNDGDRRRLERLGHARRGTNRRVRERIDSKDVA